MRIHLVYCRSLLFPQSLPGRPHWLRDVNAPDLGWPERAEQDAILPSPDWSERDWRLETQGLVSFFSD